MSFSTTRQPSYPTFSLPICVCVFPTNCYIFNVIIRRWVEWVTKFLDFLDCTSVNQRFCYMQHIFFIHCQEIKPLGNCITWRDINRLIKTQLAYQQTVYASAYLWTACHYHSDQHRKERRKKSTVFDCHFQCHFAIGFQSNATQELIVSSVKI